MTKPISPLLTFNAASSDYCVVYVTYDDKQKAEALSETLVAESLAACVNLVGPVTSMYQWQGKLERTSEWLLIIKTETMALERLNQRIQELHDYRVPEVIALPIVAGSSNYLSWLGENVHL